MACAYRIAVTVTDNKIRARVNRDIGLAEKRSVVY